MSDSKQRIDRKAANRERVRENIRSELKGKQYLRQIEEDYSELSRIDSTLKNAKTPAQTERRVKKAETRIKIIKLKLDTNFRRLNKVLPDLKAIELSDNGGSIGEAFAAALRAAQQSRKS